MKWRKELRLEGLKLHVGKIGKDVFFIGENLVEVSKLHKISPYISEISNSPSSPDVDPKSM